MAAYTTIDDPSAYFKVQLYTGNGAANHAITFDDTDTDMQPDLVWIKNRDADDAHCVFDVARGVTKVLHSDTTDAEVTDTDTLDSFASDGFQVDADVKVNTNTEDYVAWCWNTQGGAGSSNTDGSINTTTTSVGTTQKISISTYTGTGSNATIGHGLGAAPSFIWIKQRAGTTAHMVGHDNLSTGWTDYLTLHSSDPEYDDATMWQDTDPTSTVFSIGTDNTVNASSGTYVAYAFANVQGFSKFGSYTGNDNADGTFVYTGFKPALVITKKTSASGASWQICDNKRPGYNPIDDSFSANTVAVEATHVAIDFCANGFKCRNSNRDSNHNASYIYMAFAEAPFVNSEGVPNNAE